MNDVKSLKIITIALFCVVNSVSASTVFNTKQKPIIIFIITDDQAMGDVGCMGNPYIKIPQIDQFYANAVRFTNYLVGTTYAPTQSTIRAVQSGGCWKIEFVEDGQYSISLRRFPRESGPAINATFPAQKEKIELSETAPAGVKSNFTKASFYVANVDKSEKIEKKQEEITFKAFIPAGKYEMEAQLIDEVNRVHPAYNVYIEKL